jgi:2-aminoadipate transaminase
MSDTTGSRLDPWVANYASRASSMTASEIRSLFAVASRPEVVSLAGGMPYVQALPLEQMAETVSKLILERGATALQYGSGQGDPFLREQIVDYMSEVGITANPDDIVVTTGSQMALDLMVRVFCNPGDVVLVESPSYVGALGVFRAYECEVVHVSVDEEGLNPTALQETIDSLRAAGKTIKLIYTIPSFQNPGGVTQGPERRLQILDVAKRNHLLILEDDPYSMLSFDGDAPRAIRADDNENVVYLGSFSKTIAAGLRVGWVLAPHGIREKLVLAAESAILCPSNFAQLTVSSYLSTQPWREQIRIFTGTYKERRDAMISSMDVLMPKGTTWTVPKGGFFTWVQLPEGFDSRAMLPRAVTALVAYVPGTGFYVDGRGQKEMRLSFCYPTPERIQEGVRRLAGVMEQEAQLIETFGADSLPQTEMPNLAATPAPNVR